VGRRHAAVGCLIVETVSKALDLARQQRARALGAGESAHTMTRTLRPDPVVLEQERILPPGAAGIHGTAYKLLRTQVLKRLDQIHANTLAVLSPCTNDGKTLTAINLAISIAAEYDRTALLVDFDLRNPGLHRRLGIEPTVGVDECLQSGRSVQDALVRLEGYERLAILPAKATVANSSELLLSPRGTAFFNELKSRYTNRVMIFDLPPVLQADDALAFSRLVQAGLIVVGEGRTSREDLLRTMSLLRDLPMVGSVLNGSKEPARPYY
jgi:protein-tyrosine kinase